MKRTQLLQCRLTVMGIINDGTKTGIKTAVINETAMVATGKRLDGRKPYTVFSQIPFLGQPASSVARITNAEAMNEPAWVATPQATESNPQAIASSDGQ